MLALAEYSVLSQELLRLARQAESKIDESIDSDMFKASAIKITKEIALAYYDDYQALLESGLLEIAENAVSFYEQKSDVQLKKGFVKDVVNKAYEERYFGAALAQRIIVNRKRLERNITKSSQVSVNALKGVLTNPVPFGAQYNIDKRVLLATAVKIEQDVAKEFAESEEHSLIRWRLSPMHAKPDVCDELATNVDKSVVSYLEKHKIKENPKGLYFANSLPHPPHPNCQCEYSLVTGRTKSTSGRVKRTVRTIRRLLERFKGK